MRRQPKLSPNNFNGMGIHIPFTTFLSIRETPGATRVQPEGGVGRHSSIGTGFLHLRHNFTFANQLGLFKWIQAQVG